MRAHSFCVRARMPRRQLLVRGAVPLRRLRCIDRTPGEDREGPRPHRRLGGVARTGEDSWHAYATHSHCHALTRRGGRSWCRMRGLPMAARRSGRGLARLKLTTRGGDTGVADAPVEIVFAGTSELLPLALRVVWRRRSDSSTARARIRTRLRAGRAPGQGQQRAAAGFTWGAYHAGRFGAMWQGGGENRMQGLP